MRVKIFLVKGNSFDIELNMNAWLNSIGKTTQLHSIQMFPEDEFNHGMIMIFYEEKKRRTA